jgi:hypothetical protein
MQDGADPSMRRDGHFARGDDYVIIALAATSGIIKVDLTAPKSDFSFILDSVAKLSLRRLATTTRALSSTINKILHR